MAKKKPGAVMGRPKGSGAGLDVSIGLRVAPSIVEALDAAAAEQGTDRSTVVREIFGRWAKRRPGKR